MRKLTLLLSVFGLSLAVLITLYRCGHFDVIDEASGLTPSNGHAGVFWTLNDSGGGPQLFAINDQRELLSTLMVKGATNVDWESITSDRQGHLYIGDFGNNANERRDLAIYRVQEPAKLAEANAYLTTQAEVFRFRYSEQSAFPDDSELNFDAEAMFYMPRRNGRKGMLYLLTKHRSDTRTALYAFRELKANQIVAPELVDTFDVGGAEHWFGGSVTGASVDPDGQRLAILTYHEVFIFDVSSDEVTLKKLLGSVKLEQSRTQQVEGIAWDGEKLLMVNEQGDIFHLPKAVWSSPNRRFPDQN